MNVVILDEDDFDRARILAESIIGAGAVAVVCHKGKFRDLSRVELPRPTHVVLTLFHQRNKSALKGTVMGEGLTISYSGGGGADIPRPISAAAGFTKREADHIIGVLGKIGTSEDLKRWILSYWRTHLISRCALRVLCEAWLYKYRTDGTQPTSAMIKTAVTPNQWFAAFGPPGQPPYTPSQSAAIAIAEQMGSAKDKAEEFLTRLAGLYETGQHIMLNDTGFLFEKDIEELCAALKPET